MDLLSGLSHYVGRKKDRDLAVQPASSSISGTRLYKRKLTSCKKKLVLNMCTMCTVLAAGSIPPPNHLIKSH
ncbi:hypothetical protein [Rubritalea tangerina]|uniref:hypothetical protein n=1 Tax=Rubritalea tangerina TaxID=430798 RepID=UPI00360DE86B